MKKIISIVATSLMLLLVSNAASAVPIQGRIDFVGGASITSTATAITAIKFDTVNVSNFDPIVTGDFTKNDVLKYFDYEIFGEMKNAKYLDTHGLFVGNHQVVLKEEIEHLFKVLS